MQIWADGSFDNYTNEAGLGILIRQLVKNGIKEVKLKLKTVAEDNNQAELMAIYYGLKNIMGSSKNEPIFIITDSSFAIQNIKFPRDSKEKYTKYVMKIRELLKDRKWRIYHRKAHTRKKDKYTNNQALTDMLAKEARIMEGR